MSRPVEESLAESAIASARYDIENGDHCTDIVDGSVLDSLKNWRSEAAATVLHRESTEEEAIIWYAAYIAAVIMNGTYCPTCEAGGH